VLPPPAFANDKASRIVNFPPQTGCNVTALGFYFVIKREDNREYKTGSHF